MLQRRFLLSAVLFAASVATVPAFAQTQSYPSRPVRLVIPFAPGGASDYIARILQPKFAAELGQQLVVDNRPGASGGIGVETAATATPDGYTLLLGNVSALGIGPNLFTTIRKNASNLVPITLVVDVPGALGIHGGLPPNNLKEFIAYAKANQGKLSYGSAGYASAQRMAFEFFMSKAGIKMLHVPYKGGAGASTVATISGEVAATMVTTASLVPHAKSGRIKVLAVVAKKRIPALPDTPTMIESGFPELDLGSWQGIYVPKGTPNAIIDKLYKITVKVVNDPGTGQLYSKVSAQQVTSDSPAEFAKFMRNQVAFWGKVTKDLNIKVE
jgi:tripartite-type tricarboxylate transporter receptor subunit TctC